MKFLLNKSVVSEREEPAYTSLLEYIRDNQQLTGTKEGCASGDCGACTVLIGDVEGNEITYTATNACITPLYSVKNKHVVTVEHLAKDQTLHPIQKEMVCKNGSQCGFCTPGFVMSLTGLYEKKRASSDCEIYKSDVCDAISGNLCRCTGYKPIVEAALSIEFDNESVEALYTKEQVSRLVEWDGSVSELEHYYYPNNLTELDQILQNKPNARMVAGGTDLMLEVTQRYNNLNDLIDLSFVNELISINDNEESILIGSAVTYSKFEELIKEYSSSFLHLLERLGSRQIRNKGTLGGNIANASPIADTPPILLAMDADLHLRDSNGKERIVSMHEFYLSYKKTVLQKNEYIKVIEIKKSKFKNFHRFYKISKRMEDDISSVMAAIRFKVENDNFVGVRLAFGGVAATPVRVLEAEQVLLNKPVNDETVIQIALTNIENTLKPIDDVRASATYRLEMASNLVYKAWLELNDQTVPNVLAMQEKTMQGNVNA